MNVASTALYSRLTGTSALTNLLSSTTAVGNQLVSQGTGFPYVIFQEMSEVDDNASPHRTKQILYLVKGVSRTGFAEAGRIDAAIDAALHRLPLTITGWGNYLIRRESSVEYVEPLAGGGFVYHSGGIYRLRITQ